MEIRTFRDLEVWQRSMDLAVAVHRATRQFPKAELFSLTSQLQRSSQSVPYNIAEGQGRIHRGDFVHHLSIARGSLNEMDTQLELAQRLGYLDDESFSTLSSRCQEVGCLLNGLIRSLPK